VPPVTRTLRLATEPSVKTQRWAVSAGTPRHAGLEGGVVGKLDGVLGGHDDELGGGIQGARLIRGIHPHALADTLDRAPYASE